jgi:glycosyltransferase involved in cell wall biosynthesis
MREALRNELCSFDLVHVHGLWNVPGWLAIDACRTKRLPYVISPRGMLDSGSLAHHKARKTIAYHLHERKNLRSARLLHATSAREGESLRRLDLGPEVVVIPNGVDEPKAPKRSDFRSRRALPANRAIVTFLGRLHPTKRLDLLREAFRILQRTVPRSLLVLAGRPDGVQPGSLALGEGVRWLGELGEPEKWELLDETSVLVLCSDSESFGVSVLEGLAAGVPVVVTRTCPWEEVQTRGCGLWVEQSAAAIAEGIRVILSDSKLAKDMGHRGRALVEERYQWPLIGREMARRYERVRAGVP